MTQLIPPTINPAVTDGIELAQLLSDFFKTYASQSKGPSRPVNLLAGGLWVQDDEEILNNLLKINLYDGTSDITVFSLDLNSGGVSLGATADELQIIKASDDEFGPILDFVKKRLTGSATLINDVLGNVQFSVVDASGIEYDSARIRAVSTDNATSTVHGSRLDFFTTQQGSNSTSRKMSLTGDGKLGVGTAAPDSTIHAKGQSTIEIKSEREADDAVGPKVNIKKARLSGNGQTLNADSAGIVQYSGEDEAGTEQGLAQIEVVTEENTSTAGHGSKLIIRHKKIGQLTYTDAIVISDTGVNIPLAVTGPLNDRVTSIENDIGVANGIATLDANGEVPLSQLPQEVQDGLSPQGNWDASTNTPDITLAPVAGQYWIVSVAGTTNLGGITDWEINDWAVYTSGGWAKIDQSNKVITVNGQEGNVVLDADDIAETTTRYWDIKHNRTALVDPTVSNDSTQFYSVGSRWLIPGDAVEYICLDNTAGAAIWEQISGGGTGSLTTWLSIKAETNKLKDFILGGSAAVTVQTSNVFGGKSSYQLNFNALGDSLTIEKPATQGAIDAAFNELKLATETTLSNIRISILDGNDDSEIFRQNLLPSTGWIIPKLDPNFKSLVGPTIKIKLETIDATTGTLYFDAISADSDPRATGEYVEVNKVRLSGNGGEVITADTENVVFNGSGTGWSSVNYNYSIQKTGCSLLLNGMIEPTAASPYRIGIYVNGTLVDYVNPANVNATTKGFTYLLPEEHCVVGNLVSVRVNAGITLLNVANLHYLNIEERVSHRSITVESNSQDTNEIWFNSSSLGAITDSKYPDNSGVTVLQSATGIYDIDYTSLGLTVNPSFAPSTLVTLNIGDIAIRNITTTSCQVLTTTANGAVIDAPFSLTIKKNAPDYNKKDAVVITLDDIRANDLEYPVFGKYIWIGTTKYQVYRIAWEGTISTIIDTGLVPISGYSIAVDGNYYKTIFVGSAPSTDYARIRYNPTTGALDTQQSTQTFVGTVQSIYYYDPAKPLN